MEDFINWLWIGLGNAGVGGLMSEHHLDLKIIAFFMGGISTIIQIIWFYSVVGISKTATKITSYWLLCSCLMILVFIQLTNGWIMFGGLVYLVFNWILCASQMESLEEYLKLKAIEDKILNDWNDTFQKIIKS